MNYSQYKPPSCSTCTLLTQPGPCWGSGDSTHAKLIYIAQNPGDTEVRANPMQPLIGPSGRVFNRQLTESGLSRSDFFITNQVKCLTPDNREPTAGEIACCRPLLAQELARCKADTVLLAGDVAFKANIGSYSSLSPRYKVSEAITTRMGCVERKDGRKWIGTIHPAFIMRMPDWKQSALDHLKKAAAIAGVEIGIPKVYEHPEPEDIARHRDAALNGKIFADDVETFQQNIDWSEDDYVGGDWDVDICGFSAVPYEAIVLDKRELIGAWADLWLNPSLWQCEHNGEYERYHLEKLCPQKNHRWDTMHAFHYLRNWHASGGSESKSKKSGTRLALKPAALSIFSNLPYYDRSVEKALGRRFYNGLDNIATLLIAKEQMRQMQSWKLTEAFLEIGMPLARIVEQWRREGCNVDMRRALVMRRFMEKRVEQGEAILSKLLGPFFNPNSSQQVAKLLYETWKLPVQYNEVKRGRSIERKITTDNEARKRLRKWVHGLPEEHAKEFRAATIFLEVQDYLEGEKTKLTFLDRIQPDFRLHPSFRPHGTKFFRLSSVPNLQNWPVYDVTKWGGARRDTDSEGAESPVEERLVEGGIGSLRSIVIPDHEDDLLLTVDYAQIELWMYMIQSGCKWLRQVYDSGDYIYGVVYEDFYKQPFFKENMPRTKANKRKDVSEKYLRRAKAIPLGFNYGRSIPAVCEEHGWTIAEGTEYYNKWFGLCPELKVMWARDKYLMEQKGWIRYPFGHIIHFPTQKPTEVYAARGQNPAFGVLATSIVLIEDALERLSRPARIMLSVHDSLTFNVLGARRDPSRMISLVENVIQPILSRPIKQLDNFSFRYACEVSPRWDWDTIDYDKWKALNYESGATGSNSYSTIGGKET